MIRHIRSRQQTRIWSLLLAIIMVIQVGGLMPKQVHASAVSETYAEDGTIHFVLPKSAVSIAAKGDFNGWGDPAAALADEDGDGTYTAELTGDAPNKAYGYKFLVNGNWLDDPNLSVTSDENSIIRLSYTPHFKVAGSFDENAFADQHEMALSEGSYTFAAESLADGTYTYKFISAADGLPSIWFLDPTHTDTSNGNSKILVGEAPVDAPAPDVFANQPGGSAKWVVAGSFQGWNNASTETQMSHLAGEFYAYSTVLDPGRYEFKLVRQGTWDGYSDNGNNFAFTLAAQSKVNFYVNDELGQVRISVPGASGIPQYTPAQSAAEWPRLVGDIQAVLGESAWAPDQAKQRFVDYNFDGSVYKLQRTLPAGRYEMKVVLGDNWSTDNYGAGGDNFILTTIDPADVTFSTVLEERTIVTNYKPADSQYDGTIKRDKLLFDSRSVTYKKPFGAIKEGSEDVTLRIATEAGDAQVVRAELSNPEGIASAFDMHKATSFDNKDYWEVTIPGAAFQGIGVWGYKFILIDGAAKIEYGDDGSRGGTGTTADEGVLPYDLTVYDKDFTTPDWMKNAVVYQIFPDRFYDGDKSNNRAKTEDGYRGPVQGDTTTAGVTAKGGYELQYFDGGVTNDPTPGQVEGTWTTAPENPDRITPEQKPYFPDAKSDGVWTNEFYGGDIQGASQNLDYLKSIGVNVIYFNPVAWAASNHKYDATDYEHLDPMFGEPVYNTPGDPSSGLDYEATRVASDRVFTDFAKKAHDMGFKLIVDGVFNHVGDDSIYFDRYEKYPEIGAYEFWAKVYDKVNDEGAALETAKQQVIDSFTAQINPATGGHYAYPEDFDFTTWFTVSNEKVDGHYKYEGWWGYDSLPVIDALTPAAGDAEGLEGNHEWNVQGYRDLVIGHDLTGKSDEEASAMMQEANSQRWGWMGANGWRLDVAPDVSSGTWQKFREAVKSTEGRKDSNGETIPEPIILGEEWGVATKFLLGDQFDSVMNYRFRGALQGFIISGNAQQFNDALESIREDYPAEAWEVMLNLVDSHDTIRSITKYDKPEWEEEHLAIAPEPSDKALQMQALTAIFQMGYPGAPTIYYGDEVGLAGTKDPDSRRAFPWERVSGSNGTYAGVGRYASLFDTYQKAGGVRDNNEVFRTGDLKTAYNTGDVIAYARKTGSQGGLVAINRGSSDATIQVDVAGFLPEGLTLEDQLGSGMEATVAGGKIALTVKAMSGLMMISTTELVQVPEVQNLHATGGNGKVTLTWDASAGATGYNVYRAAIEGGQLQLVGQPTDISWTDSDVVNGKKYYYTVTAVTEDGESPLSEYGSATPSFPVGGTAVTKQSEEVTLGVGHKTSEIEVTIDIPGLTDDAAYAGKEAPNVIARLAFYKDDANKANAEDTKLRYKADTEDGKKIYWAAFEPTEAGTYSYYARVSTDNGESYTDSAEAAVNVQADSSDTAAPKAPVLSDIAVESNRVLLNWTEDAEEETVDHFEIYRKAADSDFVKIAAAAKTAVSYVDFTVSNDTAYTYKVAAVDSAYNRAFSGEQSVTPKLVMVDVKLRVHLPGYTPVQDDIYLAGDLNGWNSSGNKLNVPSGATTRDVVEYSFKMMAGKTIQYKYTRGTWATEAFTSHARVASDTVDAGNYAYSSTDTNMRLTIKNQGGNTMVVDDYVLRWVDMPMIVTMPRISYGEDISYETGEESFTLKSNVPYGVDFTINGQPLAEGAMDAYGNVSVDHIALQPGVNRFTLHIEPSAETLAQEWYTDKGRASQATKTIELVITREGGESGSGNGNGSGGVTPGSSSVTVTEQQLKDAVKQSGDGKATIAVEGKSEVLLPMNTAELLNGKALELKQGDLTLLVPGAVLQELLKKAGAGSASHIVLKLQALAAKAQKELIDKAAAASGVELKPASEVYDFRLAVVDGSGKDTAVLSTFVQPLKLTFKLDSEANQKLTGIYYVADNGKLEYNGGTVNADGTITTAIHHFSSYAALEYAKTFEDVPLSHWAGEMIRELASHHVITGVTADRFEPERSVTRAEFAALLVRAMNLKAAKPAGFTDVASGSWYEGSVNAAAEAGIIRGRTATIFSPNAVITREEMAVMLMRAYEAKSGKKAEGGGEGSSLIDSAAIHNWAKESIEAAVKLGFLNGKGQGQFDPQGNTTRAESAKVIFKLLGL
ncbi:alpha-amylase family glycosyl hydrolase [Paenibacillus glycanilyticus]|uniref:alpha-amylase family glycosyl hydrolase n=1 Tax=Paenibacillus glycanilyticus TaxID=126569 RepID=UPI00203C322E|nr:alpha-amylase family glycosyl hydrolase [Paenibacillus glycanilyticus]MCM3630489.1 alpha-amylase family glycosyl hydrolase [Paenibacillus glycanilyticus]